MPKTWRERPGGDEVEWVAGRSRAASVAAGKLGGWLFGRLLRRDVLLHPDIQKRFWGDTTRFRNSTELLSQRFLYRKVHYGRLEVDLELHLLRLIPMIPEIMGIPEFANFRIRRGARDGASIFGHIFFVQLASCLVPRG